MTKGQGERPQVEKDLEITSPKRAFEIRSYFHLFPRFLMAATSEQQRHRAEPPASDFQLQRDLEIHIPQRSSGNFPLIPTYSHLFSLRCSELISDKQQR